jgi:hypothetical protein
MQELGLCLSLLMRALLNVGDLLHDRRAVNQRSVDLARVVSTAAEV